jgi:hypothetical protein
MSALSRKVASARQRIRPQLETRCQRLGAAAAFDHLLLDQPPLDQPSCAIAVCRPIARVPFQPDREYTVGGYRPFCRPCQGRRVHPSNGRSTSGNPREACELADRHVLDYPLPKRLMAYRAATGATRPVHRLFNVRSSAMLRGIRGSLRRAPPRTFGSNERQRLPATRRGNDLAKNEAELSSRWTVPYLESLPRRRLLMELILVIVVLVLLFGGGGYWGRRRGHW